MRVSLSWLCFALVVLSISCGGDDNDPIPQDTVAEVENDVQTGDVTQDISESSLPRTLPFVFERPADGEAPSLADVTSMTSSLTGLWKEVGYFRWILRTSMGNDASTGQDDFLSWFNDSHAVKTEGVVTLVENGGEHNMWIPSSKVLSEAVNGCALTGDWDTCKVAEQYCKGLTATVKGFVWGDDDPAPYLMARAVFPNDNECVMDEEQWKDDGRTKRMEFHDSYRVEDGWNAHSFAWPQNPTWGDIWVTNMRSKDDVCAIVRTTAFLPYVIADAPYDWVKTACEETMETMRGFNKDIVDYGYMIRTKDPDGSARLVTEEDLGSYVEYIGVGEENECAARLASDLIAYQEPRTNDCGPAFPTVYDMVSVSIHYYNYPIVWNYHMAALGNALVYGWNDVAYRLLQGLTVRIDTYLDPETEEPGAEDADWEKDMAVLLVQAAALGLPLTGREAGIVHKHFSQAVLDYQDWEYWDLWDAAIPDGEYSGGSFRPRSSVDGIPIEALALFLEYCNSPFKNPAGASFVDCELVSDVSRWGE